jgi:hypothetical protein
MSNSIIAIFTKYCMYCIIYNIYLLVSALVTGSSATIPFFEPRPNKTSVENKVKH